MTTFYADEVNSQFDRNESHYVSLKQRLIDSTQKNWKKSIIRDAVANFKTNKKNIKFWQDMTFCRAINVKLNLIEIDATLQRILSVSHVGNILNSFTPIKVMPICVYEDPARPGKYICWDGQHTAIVLYIIASQILNLNIEDIEVPVVVYASNLKSDMRECFISLNGEGKTPLDHIDKIHQKIFGVRTDGSQDPNWLMFERKQQYFEQHKLFLTDAKFGDTDKPGAFARYNEFIDDRKYHEVITENFAKYYFKICQGSRPTSSGEIWMMYDFFNLCFKRKITVDDSYILGVVNSLQLAFNGDFAPDEMYERARLHHQDWWRSHHNGELLGINYPERRIAMDFLLAQIGKNFSGPIPTADNPIRVVSTSELF